jgi:hypothetical protein
VEDARLLSIHREAGRLCLVRRTDDTLELWDLTADRKLFSDQLSGARDLLALPAGCVALTGRRQVRRYDAAGHFKDIASEATALGGHGETLLVAAGSRVLTFDGAGAPAGTLRGAEGAVALTRVGESLVLGFGNGTIEKVSTSGGRSAIPLEDPPSSPVVRMLEGPSGTVVVGFANGVLGIWSLDNGLRLARVKLHGPVTHLLIEGGKLYASTELGSHRVVDLGVFDRDYCKLVRQLWRQVPTGWERGLPVLRPPPARHRCAAAAGR